MAVLNKEKPIIGMVHLLPLFGTPKFAGEISSIYERAIWEAEVLEQCGVDALIIENFGDEPFMINKVSSVQFALMSGVLRDIKRAVSIPIGLNVQFNAWKAEMSIAFACGAEFIRVEVYVDNVVTAQGMVHPCSTQLSRYRKLLNADVQIWADIQTKYTTNIIPQSLLHSAVDAVNAGADALIVTGEATGKATSLDVVRELKKEISIPVLFGSGTTTSNVKEVLSFADGAIVGSAFKEKGLARNKVSRTETTKFMNIAKSL